jgi:hypothetical protein
VDLNYLSEWTRRPGGEEGRKKIDNYFVEVFFKPSILCRVDSIDNEQSFCCMLGANLKLLLVELRSI